MTSIFDRSHRSYAAATSAKYERGKRCFDKSENLENNGREEIGLEAPKLDCVDYSWNRDDSRFAPSQWETSLQKRRLSLAGRWPKIKPDDSTDSVGLGCGMNWYCMQRAIYDQWRVSV